MEKLERVRRMTYRRMGQVDSELERFEERPELDTRKRYSSLRKRFEELETLYYHLRRKDVPNPHHLIERILAEQSTRMMMQPDIRRDPPTFRVTGGEPARPEYHGILPPYGG